MKSARILLQLSTFVAATACTPGAAPTTCTPVAAAPILTPAAQPGSRDPFLSFDMANQRPIGPRAMAFATYLLEMHKRIHPLFAGKLFEDLEQLPKASPLNNPNLVVRVAIIIGPDGRREAMAVVQSSGMTLFDLAAFDIVSRAAPFGPTPAAIRSSDGNVYVTWDFHRSELACELAGARPFILGSATAASARATSS